MQTENPKPGYPVTIPYWRDLLASIEQVCPDCGHDLDDGSCGNCAFVEPPAGVPSPLGLGGNLKYHLELQQDVLAGEAVMAWLEGFDLWLQAMRAHVRVAESFQGREGAQMIDQIRRVVKDITGVGFGRR